MKISMTEGAIIRYPVAYSCHARNRFREIPVLILIIPGWFVAGLSKILLLFFKSEIALIPIYVCRWWKRCFYARKREPGCTCMSASPELACNFRHILHFLVKGDCGGHDV